MQGTHPFGFITIAFGHLSLQRTRCCMAYWWRHLWAMKEPSQRRRAFQAFSPDCGLSALRSRSRNRAHFWSNWPSVNKRRQEEGAIRQRARIQAGHPSWGLSLVAGFGQGLHHRCAKSRGLVGPVHGNIEAPWFCWGVPWICCLAALGLRR